jgi:hypothetical protein
MHPGICIVFFKFFAELSFSDRKGKVRNQPGSIFGLNKGKALCSHWELIF